MKKFIIQAIALLILTFSALAFYSGNLPRVFNQNQNLTEVNIKSTKLQVELADTPEKRKKGLGGRNNLATESGMLFTFAKPGYYNFWMKGMQIPLDIIWIREGKVVDININVSSEDPSIFTPNTEVDSVLEVNAGFCDLNAIMIGDNITVAN